MSMHLWKSDGGPPWVFADNEAEARKLIANSHHGDGYTPRKVEQIPDDEKFTLHFDDVPKGLKTDCECDPEALRAPDGELYDCECGGSDAVTLTAGEWCALEKMPLDPVFGEWEG